MAEQKQPTPADAAAAAVGAADPTRPTSRNDIVNTAMPARHDRVAMLSINTDGTPDQTAPILLDPDAVAAATARQFAVQAVGAYDSGQHAAVGDTTIIGKPGDEPDEIVPATTDAVRQDPTVAAAQAKHEEITAAAEAAAKFVVHELAPKA